MAPGAKDPKIDVRRCVSPAPRRGTPASDTNAEAHVGQTRSTGQCVRARCPGHSSSSSPDRRLVCSDEPAEDATKCVEVAFREGINEVALDALLVWWPDLFEPRPTLPTEGDVETPPVSPVELPANEPVVLHPIEHSGEAAATERVTQHHRGRQFPQGKTAPGPSKMDQDVELLERQVELCEVTTEAAHDQRVRPLKLAPGGELSRGQLGHAP